MPMPTLATRATTPARVANRRDAPIARAFGDARFWRSDAQKMNALRHELETQRAETLRLHRERRIADDARAVAEERCAMYETRCERQEREIFALERQLEEKTSGVETAMSVARDRSSGKKSATTRWRGRRRRCGKRSAAGK